MINSPRINVFGSKKALPHLLDYPFPCCNEHFSVLDCTPGAHVQSQETFSSIFTCVLGFKWDCESRLVENWDHPSIYVLGLLKSNSRYQSQAKYTDENLSRELCHHVLDFSF